MALEVQFSRLQAEATLNLLDEGNLLLLDDDVLRKY